jgi:glycosyltransferase involved in cell wall biosynthesis
MARAPRANAPIVGLSTNVLDPRFNGGRLDGIGTFTLALEGALRDLGVVTLRVGAMGRRGFSLVRPTKCDVTFPIPPIWSIAASALARLPTLFTQRVERAIDVYHATDYLVPRLRHTPVVATLYDAIPLAHPEWTSQRLRRVKNHVLRAGAAHADLVIAISNAGADDIVEHYRIPRERVRVVPLGVDETWFAPSAAAVVEALARTRGVRAGCYLCVGTLQPRKNIEGLLRAYDRLPAAIRTDHQLVIAGRYGWGAEALKVELEARRADGDVLWLDYVSQAELRALFSLARAFVFPTLAEGFGLPMIEAFAAGTPVIASDLPVLREVGGSDAFFVPVGDTDALSQAMERAATSPPDSVAIEDARSRARRFDWKTTAKATLDVYVEVNRGRARVH